MQITDIAGLVPGASKGKGMGNDFLRDICKVDMLLHVVRCFEDDNVITTQGKWDPISDAECILDELLLSDIKNLELFLKNPRMFTNQRNWVKDKVLPALYDGRSAPRDDISTEQAALYRQLGILSIKPMVMIANGFYPDLDAWAQKRSLSCMYHNVLEGDLHALRTKLTHSIMSGANLCCYYTAGPKEARSWLISQDSTAPQAAGKIHGDFEKKFIRGKVISYKDYVSAGCVQSAIKSGYQRTVGKQYTMKHKDIVHWLHSA